jgi:hypothetical protein
MCLPIEKANDGNIDCAGATDEPKLCRSKSHTTSNMNFHCKNQTIQPCISSRNLCYGAGQCMDRDDEQLCYHTRNNSRLSGVCRMGQESIRTDIHKFLCERPDDTRKAQIVYFSIDKTTQLVKNLTIQNRNMPASIIPVTRQYQQHCHRGLPLRVWLNSDQNLTNETCLCPPSFYGDKCQYQNQRVSLTLQFQTYSDARRTLFALVVSLIDDSNERIIHSHQQLTYLYIQHCQIKFNIYLLYSTRPKHLTKHYSVHIDIYEKISFAYRGSFSAVSKIEKMSTLPKIR